MKPKHVLAHTWAIALLGCAGATPEADLLRLPPPPPRAGRESVIAFSSSDTVSSLADAVERALVAHPDLEAARHRLLAADAARVQAATWTNPSLKVEAEGWGLDRDGFARSELTLSAAFPIDITGKRDARVSVAQAETNVERTRYNDTRRLVVARVRSAVLAVRAGKERERLAALRLRVTEETARAVAREVAAGKAAPLEQIRAEVARESARAELSRARSFLREMRLGLGALFGRPGSEAEVTGVLRGDPVTPDSLALQQEIARHPRRLAALWSAESAVRRQRQIGREGWPELEAEVGVRRFSEEDANAWVTGLSISLPLWDRKAGALREARELGQAADQEAVSVERDLRSELAGLLAGLGESSQRLTLYRDRILPPARDALDLARKGFEGGKFGYLDLLDAQSSLLDVERDYLEALISYDESVGRLESMLGREPGNGLLPESP